jgi:uncharacterized ion transporter superfamily protein YfcC
MKLTRRGKLVRTVAFILIGVLIWNVMTKLWWTSEGYCWGSYLTCVG